MGNGTQNNPIRSYRDLVAWQRAFQLGIAVFHATKALPDHERFGMVSQLRRSSVSIASNIAEGYGRGSRADHASFFKVARASLFERETQLLFSAECGYITNDQLTRLVEQVTDSARVLSGPNASIDGDER
jgi:four helix bundle protein